jgi:hypothetical protein
MQYEILLFSLVSSHTNDLEIGINRVDVLVWEVYDMQGRGKEDHMSAG